KLDDYNEEDKEKINQVIAIRSIQIANTGINIVEGTDENNNLLNDYDKSQDHTLFETEDQTEISGPVVLQKLTMKNMHMLNFGSNLSVEEKQYIMNHLLNETSSVDILHMRLKPIQINNPKKARLFEEYLKDMI
ncbi:14097_t:CDS:2, partial [Racocetra persica]